LTFTDKIKNAIPFLRSPVRLPGDVARSLRPVRSPFIKWRTEGKDELIVIYSPRPKDQFWIGWLAKLAMEPEDRKTELDEIGSKIWNLCDGTNKVGDICKIIGNEYQLTDRQVEVSVLSFMNSLRQRKFIGLTEEDKERVDEALAKVKSGTIEEKESADKINGNTTSNPRRKRIRQQRRY
jgi:hypothetical protein